MPAPSSEKYARIPRTLRYPSAFTPGPTNAKVQIPLEGVSEHIRFGNQEYRLAREMSES